MQDDVDVEWGDGDGGHHYIQEEPTRVAALPALTRYRTFTHTLENEPIRIGRSERDFYIHKKRRYEDTGRDAANQPYARPLLRSRKDPFEVAARQLETFVWLTAHSRSASDVIARFALDRKIGVIPSQACLNRALQTLGGAGDADVILELIEDAVMDRGTLALSTAVAAVHALDAQPVRAARIALTLQGMLPSGALLPLVEWTNLGSALGRHAQRLPKPLDEHFMSLLDATIDVVRQRSDTLHESILVDYGSCLLASQRPLAAVVRLVTEELLNGRYRANVGGEGKTDTALPLGAFLTDLLVALCAVARGAATDDGNGVGTLPREVKAASARLARRTGISSISGLIAFCGDVVKYAQARKINLAPKAFDAILEVCDDAKDYYRLCILFTAMCVLSVPTLRATLRVVEVLNAVPALRVKLAGLLGRPPQELVVWCLRRYGSITAPRPDFTSTDEEALMALSEGLSTLIFADVRAGPSDIRSSAPPQQLLTSALLQVEEVASVLVSEGAYRQSAVTFLSAVIASARAASASSGTPSPLLPIEATTPQATKEHLQALNKLNVAALEGLLAAEGAEPLPAAGGFFSGAVVQQTGGGLEPALKQVLSSPQTYCNVLDASALNLLALLPAAQAAFARMMAGYVSKSGAVTVLPVELLATSFGTTDAARALTRTWLHTHSDWFTVLPLSLSFQLAGTAAVDLVTGLFKHVRQAGHQKVALVTADASVAESAKASGVQPVIFLPDLLQRLGVQVKA